MKLTKEDVWGKYDEDTHECVSKGMIVARTDEICPIFGDKVPYKSVTVVCAEGQYDEVVEWLIYVHGGDCISQMKELGGGKVALRSDYKCW